MFNSTSSVIFFLPALLLVTFLIYKCLYCFSTTSTNKPPSPRKLPVLGNLHQLGPLPHRSLQLLSKQYGELMLLHLGSVPVLIASSANSAREILKTHDSVFANRPKLTIPYKLGYGAKDIVFSPYGEYWRQVRSMAVLHLLNTKMVQSFRNIREEETSLMIDKVANLCSRSELINMTDLFVMLTNDIVCRVACGRKYSDGENGKQFFLLIREVMELVGMANIEDNIPWLAWVNHFNGVNARVEKTFKELGEFLDGVIKEQTHINTNKIESGCNLKASRGSNFVDTLLNIQKENLLPFPVQNETIKAMIADMFAAGTDTVYTVLDWTMSELIRNPLIMDKLQNEVRLIAQGKTEICEDDLVNMHYLKAVVKESLRLHPPSPFLVPRESIQNIKLMGYDIKAGTKVLINVWAIGRDPSLWEMPEEFQPERFLNSNIDFKGFDFELIPFGSGRRKCPGISFGLAVNELALAKLLHKFNFALPYGLMGENLDMTETYGLTVQKKLPVIVVARPYCD